MQMALASHPCDENPTLYNMAAPNGHVEVVRAMMEAGAEVNHVANNGCTVLYLAAHNDHVNIVRVLVLVEAGADARRWSESSTCYAGGKDARACYYYGNRTNNKHTRSYLTAGPASALVSARQRDDIPAAPLCTRHSTSRGPPPPRGGGLS